MPAGPQVANSQTAQLTKNENIPAGQAGSPWTPLNQTPAQIPQPSMPLNTTAPGQSTGFTASNPTPLNAGMVNDAHDTTSDFSNADYLKQSQGQIANTYKQYQQDQQNYDAQSQAYQDFNTKNANSNVDFYNNQLQSSGLNDLYTKQSDLTGKIAQLDATINGTTEDVRSQFGGNAPESLIQATASTRAAILNKQKATLTAQLDAINSQVTNKTNVVDKLTAANEQDLNHQLTTMSAQTGIAKDDLSNGLSLYKDAVSTFNGDRTAARQATLQIIAQSPFAADALSANPQAMQDVQNGMITPAVLGVIGTTYKAQQAADKMQQLQQQQQQNQASDQIRQEMAAIAQQRANAYTTRVEVMDSRTKTGGGSSTPGSDITTKDGKVTASDVLDSLTSSDPTTWPVKTWEQNRVAFVKNFGEKAAKSLYDTNIKQPTTNQNAVNQPKTNIMSSIHDFFKGAF